MARHEKAPWVPNPPRSVLRAATFLPGVCLIDLHMPGMEGDELAARLRTQAAGGRLALVAVTAMGDEASRKRVRDAGFAVHLVKPVDPHDLLAVVDELWRAWSAQESRPTADPL